MTLCSEGAIPRYFDVKIPLTVKFVASRSATLDLSNVIQVYQI